MDSVVVCFLGNRPVIKGRTPELLTLQWYILVLKVTFGGLNGYLRKTYRKQVNILVKLDKLAQCIALEAGIHFTEVLTSLESLCRGKTDHFRRLSQQVP